MDGCLGSDLDGAGYRLRDWTKAMKPDRRRELARKVIAQGTVKVTEELINKLAKETSEMTD